LYTWAQNCASGSAGDECRQDRQEFRDALATIRKAADNLEAGSAGHQKLEAILAKYGDEGEKNKVSIAFGSAGGYPAEEHTSLFGNKTITFDMKMINDQLNRNEKINPAYTAEEGRGETVAHEGSHMLDKFFFGDPVNRAGSARTEHNAFNSQSYVPMGLNSNSAYGLWNPSWVAVDFVVTMSTGLPRGVVSDALRSNAVQDVTDKHVNEMWNKK
jgi:hypothetical protein